MGRGLQAKYLLPCCCICDSLEFDMQHDIALKKLNFHLLIPRVSGGGGGGGGVLQAKYLVPCCYIL